MKGITMSNYTIQTALRKQISFQDLRFKLKDSNLEFGCMIFNSREIT